MKYYFDKFLQSKLSDFGIHTNKAYLYILWLTNENLSQQGRISDAIKSEVDLEEAIDIDLLDFDRIRYNLSKQAATTLDNNVKEINSSKLVSVQVKNFKGFKSAGSDDKGKKINFHRNKTIFFAPNGGGKTSLCEALEYKLTGNIKEARRRGFKSSELRRYFSNCSANEEIFFHENGFNELSDAEKEFFKTCFIEKNRIQEFAFLGSKDTFTKQKDVIATLFGLEELLALTLRFVLPSSFRLSDKCKTIYKDKLARLEKENVESLVNIQIKEQYRVDKETFLATELETDESHNFDIEFNKKKKELKDSIKTLTESIKSYQVPSFLNQEKEHIVNLFTKIHSLLEKHKTLIESLTRDSEKVNYKALYDAIVELSVSNLAECPACKTPLSKTENNPFERAKAEKENLKLISETQQAVKDTEQEIILKYDNEVNPFLYGCFTNLDKFNILNEGVKQKIAEFIDFLGENRTDQKKIELTSKVCDYVLSNDASLDEYFRQIKEVSEQIDTEKQKVEANNTKLQSLKTKIDIIQREEENLNSIKNDLTSLKETVRSYETNKETFTSNLEIELKFNQFLQEIEENYVRFHKDLIDFKNQTESRQFGEIEDLSAEYYRRINKHDTEVLKKIRFVEESDNYQIKLKFDNRETEENAFAYLSEGHTRALGLSLMLAIAENKPFLVFDDVVNAIDSEHRANIINLLFEHEKLKDKQLIITTHDRLFWERFCMEAHSNSFKSYVLTYENHNGGICSIDYNVKFVQKIEESLKYYDIRQALIYCRIWFETMVSDFCIKKQIEISARFSDRNKEKSNLLKITLNTMYVAAKSELVSYQAGYSLFCQVYDQGQKWFGMNEANHSLSENALNFSHSNTSIEVTEIFEKLQQLEFYLCPQKCESEMVRLNRKREVIINNIAETNNRFLQNEGFMANASLKIRTEKEQLFETLNKNSENIKRQIQNLATIKEANDSYYQQSEL